MTADRKCKKMNQTEFVEYLMATHDLSREEAKRMYQYVIQDIIRLVSGGTILSLNDFGTFELKIHKGHPIQFQKERMMIPDYPVFKFTASNALNKQIRSAVNCLIRT